MCGVAIGSVENVFERSGDLALMLGGCDASDISMKVCLTMLPRGPLELSFDGIL